MLPKIITLVLAMLPQVMQVGVIGGTKAASSGSTIAYVQECHNDTGSASSLAITCAINIGDTVVVLTHTLETGGMDPVTSVTDDGAAGGNTYTPHVSTMGSTVWSDGQTTTATKTATTITINLSPNATTNACALIYTGVTSIGNTGVDSNTSAIPVKALTMQDTNNYIIASNSAYAPPGASSSPIGTLRVNAYNNNQASSIITCGDNTQAGTGSLSWGYTQDNSTLWQVIAIELRTH